MPFINDRVFDNGLSVLTTELTRVDICTQEPATYTEATSTYTKGNKTSVSVGSVGDRSPSGRKVTIAAITSGSVTGTGTVTHWAGTDPANSRLLATNSLSASQAVTNGNTFSLTATDIGIPDAA